MLLISVISAVFIALLALQHNQVMIQPAYDGDIVNVGTLTHTSKLLPNCTLSLGACNMDSSFRSSQNSSLFETSCVVDVYITERNPSTITSPLGPLHGKDQQIKGGDCLPPLPNLGNFRAPFMDVGSVFYLDLNTSSSAMVIILRNTDECRDLPYMKIPISHQFTKSIKFTDPGYYRFTVIPERDASIDYSLTIDQVLFNKSAYQSSCILKETKSNCSISNSGTPTSIHGFISLCNGDGDTTQLYLSCPVAGRKYLWSCVVVLILVLIILMSISIVFFLISCTHINCSSQYEPIS